MKESKNQKGDSMRTERLFGSVRSTVDTRPEKVGMPAVTPEVAFHHQTPITRRFILGKKLFTAWE